MSSETNIRSQRRRLVFLWIGLGTWFLIFVNAARYAGRFPYTVFLLGACINLIVLISFILAIRAVYKRGRDNLKT